MSEIEELVVRFKGDDKDLKRAINSASTSLNNYSQKVKVAAKSNKKAASETDKFKGKLRNLASSVAIIDGPLGGVASRINAFATTIGRLPPAMIPVTAALISFSAATHVGIKNFKEFEKLSFRLESVLKTTGKSASVSAGELKAFAKQLGIDTLTSRAASLEAISSVLTFENIAPNKIKDVVTHAQNLSAVFGGGLQQNAILLGRALNDPVSSLEALKRKGINFTKSEKDLLKSLVETNKHAEAQAIIFKKLEVFSGAAADEAKGLEGVQDSLAEAVANTTSRFADFFFLVEAKKVSLSGLTKFLNSVEKELDGIALDSKLIREEFGALFVKGGASLGIFDIDEKSLDIEIHKMRRISEIQRELVSQGFSVSDALEEARRRVEGITDQPLTIRVTKALFTEDQFKASKKALEGVLTPLEKYKESLAKVNELERSGALAAAARERGLTSGEVKTRLVAAATKDYKDALKAANAEITRNKNQLADFFSESSKGFESFRDTAVSALQDILRNMMRLSFGGSADDSLFGTIAKAGFGAIAGSIGGGTDAAIEQAAARGAADPSLFGPGFATGGDFTVGGVGGRDANTVQFKATKGEQVSIRTPQQMRSQSSGSGIVQNINISTGVAQTVRTEMMRLLPAFEQRAVQAMNNARARGMA